MLLVRKVLLFPQETYTACKLTHLCIALIAVPNGPGATDFSGGRFGGVGSAAVRSQAARASDEAITARRERPDPLPLAGEVARRSRSEPGSEGEVFFLAEAELPPSSTVSLLSTS